MIWVKILINFIHLASSYAWLGSIIFIAFVVKPILKKEIEAISSEILKVFFSVFRKITVISVILIGTKLIVDKFYGILFLARLEKMLLQQSMVFQESIKEEAFTGPLLSHLKLQRRGSQK